MDSPRHEEKEYKTAYRHPVTDEGKCLTCHMIHNSPNDLRLWGYELGPGDDGMEKLCRSCHQEGGISGHKMPKNFNHPTDVFVTYNRARMKRMKKGKPLPVFKINGKRTKTGVITCPTCHNPHQWSALEPDYGPGKVTEGDATNSFLRGVSDFAVCSDCHGFDGLFRYKYYHGDTSRKKDIPLRGVGQ